MPVAKHIPQRTCIACGQIKPKREMVRLVCVAGDAVEIDPIGKKAGRGAYLCRLADCWTTGFKGNRVERALRTNLGQESRKRLVEELKELCGGESK